MYTLNYFEDDTCDLLIGRMRHSAHCFNSSVGILTLKATEALGLGVINVSETFNHGLPCFIFHFDTQLPQMSQVIPYLWTLHYEAAIKEFSSVYITSNIIIFNPYYKKEHSVLLCKQHTRYNGYIQT
jgi:hypothetical protein